MKKLLVFMLCSFALFGCGSNDSSEKDKTNEPVLEKTELKDIEVVESGFTYDGSGYIQYGVRIHNPNKETAIEYPSFRIVCYDSNGTILSSEEQTLLYIAPQDDAYFGSVASCNGKVPEKVEITPIPAKEYNFIDDVGKSNGKFIVSNTNVLDDGYGGKIFTGEVANESGEDMQQIQMVLILRNNEKIVYGTTSYVDSVQAGAKVPFQIVSYNLPEYTSYEIYAYRW